MANEFESQHAAWDWMEEQVDDPGVDNYRFAFTNDPEAMAKYEQKRDQGCCGFFDTTVIVAGKEARIGCNYGH